MVQNVDTYTYSDKFIQLQPESVESDSTIIRRSWPSELPVFQVSTALEREQQILKQLSGTQVPALYQANPSESKQLHYKTRAYLQLSSIRLPSPTPTLDSSTSVPYSTTYAIVRAWRPSNRSSPTFTSKPRKWQLVALQREGEFVTDFAPDTLIPEQVLQYCFNSQ